MPTRQEEDRQVLKVMWPQRMTTEAGADALWKCTRYV